MASRLVVEWTRTSVRLALAEGSGPRAKIRAIASQPLGATADLPGQLKALLGAVKARGAQVVGVISREQVITRVVKFPATDVQELSRMAELYAKAQLPYPREQAVMDLHVLNQQEGFSTVAIIACQRDVVDRLVGALRETGLSLGQLTVSSWGVLGWYQQIRQTTSVEEPTLVVNVDESRTDLVLIAEGRILSSRSVGQGTQDWQGVGEIGELLAREIERSRTAVRKELPSADVKSLILTGLGALEQWKALLEPRFGLPVMLVDARATWKEWTAPPTMSCSPVVAGGVACAEPAALLNLSPPEVRGQVRHRQQVRELVTVSVLLIGVLALGSSLLAQEAFRQQQIASELEHALGQRALVARDLQEKTRASLLVGSVLDGRHQLAAILAGVLRSTPADVTLESLAYERARRELVVRGSASSTQTVLGYIAQLEALEGVGRAELRYSTRRATVAGERTDFELVLRQVMG